MNTCPVQVCMDLAAARTHLLAAKTVAFDTETTSVDHRKAILVGVSAYVPGESVGFYLPVYNVVDPIHVMLPRAAVASLVTDLFADPDRLIVMHNAIYDLLIVRKLGVQARCRLFDTMLAQHRLDNTLHHVLWKGDPLNYKLKVLTARFLGIQQQSFENATGGMGAHQSPVSAVAPYAVGDTYFTAQHYLRLAKKLKWQPGIRRVLEDLDFPCFPPVCEMLHHGVPVDTTLATQRIAMARASFTQLTQQISQLLGRPADVSKADVLRNILVKDCQIEEAARASLSERSIKRLAHEAAKANHPKAQLTKEFVSLLIARRKEAQVISKFYVPLLRRTDPTSSILYPGSFSSFNETARFSAGDPNVQALPKRGSTQVRKIIVAEPGCKIVSIDFKNIEPRCLAQALLQFVQNPLNPVESIKSANRQRAKELFHDLLEQREFRRPYRELPPLPKPTQSLLANFFLSAQTDPDPYRFVAENVFHRQMHLLTDKERKDIRNKTKTTFLATIYGRSLRSLATELDCEVGEAAQMLNKFATLMPELGVTTYRPACGAWVGRTQEFQTYRDQIEMMLRLSGEVTSLFGRKRRFAGLYHLNRCKRCRITYQWRNNYYVWDVAPIQLWNYALHCYVYSVRELDTGRLIATTGMRKPHSLVASEGMCRWPFRQLSYKSIRTVEVGEHVVEFAPIADCHRQAFNAIIQMTAGDIFKLAMLRVQPAMHKCHARMILNVHDELVFIVPDHYLHQFVTDAVTVMRQAPATWFVVPIDVDVNVGQNYGALHSYSWPLMVIP